MDTNYAGKNPNNFQKDVHILSSDAPGQLTVAFTWHGFQYAEVSVENFPGFQPSLSMLTAVALNTKLTETGSLRFEDDQTDASARCPALMSAAECATDPHYMGEGTFLNRFADMVRLTQRNNMADGLPTDCPTREKHGWLGDAQVTAEEAMFNFDTRALHAQFLRTIRDNQAASGDVPGVVPSNAPGNITTARLEANRITDISWSAAFPLITNWLYQYYGDLDIVEEMYPALENFVNMLTTQGKSEPESLADFYIWGDW